VSASLDGARASRVFEIATTIKVADQRMRSLLTSGQVQSTYYSPAGHEVVSASVGAQLRPDDYLCTTYRGMHDQISKGVPLPLLFAEYLGRVTGACKGKGGPMHITHRASNLLLTTGIVGSGLPIGVGLGWAASLKGDRQVVVVNFGDGASNIGAFHEALNLASVWTLPVIFVCANNLYAEHTPYGEGTSSKTVSQRAVSYDMPGITVDGNDASEMGDAVSDAIERARSGNGPTLIEALTFRLYGHNMNDANRYMPAGELKARREADPVARLRVALISEGVGEQDIEEIESRVGRAVDDAFEFALASDPPEESELWTDVYAKEDAR
jgi:acetoin:2,6-dichlorophenolindophenol oxidoreductase subunit alpha